jgi:hypothetical protein
MPMPWKIPRLKTRATGTTIGITRDFNKANYIKRVIYDKM